jgi:hypothetical protein
MPLGLVQAKGRLHADAYKDHHEVVLDAWNIDDKRVVASDSRVFQLEDTPCILGGGCDSGPGLKQVYENKYGAPDLNDFAVLNGGTLRMFGPCMSHEIINMILTCLNLYHPMMKIP